MRVKNLIICSLGVEDKYGVNLGGRVKNRTLAMQIQEWEWSVWVSGFMA